MQNRDELPEEVVLWGGTGQAKLVRPIIEQHYGSRVVAVFDDTPGLPSPFPDVPIYEGREGYARWLGEGDRQGIGFAIAIGNPHGRVRLELHERLATAGLVPVTLIHPTAWIAHNAEIGEGCQILAFAYVAAEARLGRQCILNGRAGVDHECVLSDAVEVGPAATLCGDIRVGTASWVAAGATVLPRLRIGADAIIGAGAVVVRDVPAGATVVGVPARRVLRQAPGSPSEE